MFSLCLQHCLRQSRLDREQQFSYEFSVEKLVLKSFRGYLGEVESEKEMPLDFFIVFFRHVQCCVRVSASNFQILTRKSDGAEP